MFSDDEKRIRLTADVDIDVFQVHDLDGALHELLILPTHSTVGVIQPSPPLILLFILLDDDDGIRPPPNPRGKDRRERPPSDAIAELVAVRARRPLE